MPLIIVCGTPVSGKSEISKRIGDYFTGKKGKDVTIISDETDLLIGDRNLVYKGKQRN